MVSERITVYVDDREVSLYRGMRVRHALASVAEYRLGSLERWSLMLFRVPFYHRLYDAAGKPEGDHMN